MSVFHAIGNRYKLREFTSSYLIKSIIVFVDFAEPECIFSRT
jgi:hypothetical protein